MLVWTFLSHWMLKAALPSTAVFPSASKAQPLFLEKPKIPHLNATDLSSAFGDLSPFQIFHFKAHFYSTLPVLQVLCNRHSKCLSFGLSFLLNLMLLQAHLNFLPPVGTQKVIFKNSISAYGLCTIFQVFWKQCTTPVTQYSISCCIV